MHINKTKITKPFFMCIHHPEICLKELIQKGALPCSQEKKNLKKHKLNNLHASSTCKSAIKTRIDRSPQKICS